MIESKLFLQQRYQLQEKLSNHIGRQTWQAEDMSLSPPEPVIIKLLGFHPQMQWDELKLFEREANILRQLNHPFIPQYRDYFTINDQILWFCLVQTYIPGCSLENLLIEGQRFTESEVIKIATNLLEILIYLHELNPVILHRDIKPSNIILGEDNQVYLVDFGAVQSCPTKEGKTFTVVGTYGYTPLEQFGGRAVPASDLYALGATLIEILTGISLSNLPQNNMRFQFRQYLSVSPHFAHWLEKLTEPNVEKRFQTARKALLALEKPEEMSQYTLSLTQPLNSRIKLIKSSHQLYIKLRGRELKREDTYLICWIFILLGATLPFSLMTFPFSLVLWLIILIPSSFFLFPLISQIELRFTRKNFSFQWRILGIAYFLVKGSNSAIQHIYSKTNNSIKPSNKPLITLAINVDNKIYQFGGVLLSISVSERRWLIQELSNWLGLTN